jgi:hypothetical protein
MNMRARVVSGGVSVGLNAVAVVNDRNKKSRNTSGGASPPDGFVKRKSDSPSRS